SMLYGLLRDMQASLRGVGEAQRTASTGKRVRQVSDDPPAGAGILQAAHGLRAVEQYRRNVSMASAHIASEETALTQLDSILGRAREIAVQQANATANAG